MSICPPEWVEESSRTIVQWLLSVMDENRFGLFRDCVDSEIPHTFPASFVGLSRLMAMKSVGLEELPGYSTSKVLQSIEFIQNCQDSNTGLYIDPELDRRCSDKDRAALRRAVTAYSVNLLGALGADPLWPYSSLGDHGVPDAQNYLQALREGDWSKPWGIGSWAGRATCELFMKIEEGHTEYIPALCRGIEFILTQYNPDTGMIGASSIPLYEQISGALKVIGQFVFRLGVELPYMNRLADSCIKYHGDKSFYSGTDDMCIPRNVAEMCVACLEMSEYRRDELLGTLDSIGEHIYSFRMPDGAFASDRSGISPIYWGGAKICGPAKMRRGNMNGTQGAIWAIGLISEYLDWDEKAFRSLSADWRSKITGWKNRVTQYKYRVIVFENMKVEVAENR